MLLAGLVFFCVLAVIYPYCIYPLLLSLLPPARTPDPKPNRSTTASLLFCAYNEETSLPQKLANLSEILAACPNLCILAYSDHSQDATDSLLAEAEREGLLTYYRGEERLGKAAGMAKMVADVNTDVSIFTDANVTIEPKSIERIIEYFADPSIGTVSGTLKYVNENESVTASVGATYWRLEERIKKLESRTGSTMGADGSIFAIRTNLYPSVPIDLLDDLIVSMTPVFHGLRCISAPDVIAYEKSATNQSDEFKRKVRIACRAFNTHKFLSPSIRKMSPINKFKYFSHKYVRWFGAVFIFLGFLFSLLWVAIHFGIQLTIAFLALLFALSYLSQVRKIPIVSSVFQILFGIVATGKGVAESIAGQSYRTWSPPSR